MRSLRGASEPLFDEDELLLEELPLLLLPPLPLVLELSPDEPEPDMPDEPEPEEPDMPDVPDVPDEPDMPVPEVPEDPDMPLPEVPEEPDMPLPDVPDEPDMPLPDVPEEPDMPLPDVPEVPDVPDMPEEPVEPLPVDCAPAPLLPDEDELPLFWASAAPPATPAAATATSISLRDGFMFDLRWFLHPATVAGRALDPAMSMPRRARSRSFPAVGMAETRRRA